VIVYHEPGLFGLELWNGLARHAPLYRLRESPREYFEGLREFLLALRAGTAATEDDPSARDLKRAAGFERLILCGGDATNPLLEQMLAPVFPVNIDSSGQFAARRGAIRIFEQMGWKHGTAFDLGQFQLKILTASGGCTIPRDTEKLPFGKHALDAETGKARLQDLIREALLQIDPATDGFVLGLPVALDCHGIAQPSTYPGLRGPVEPIFAHLFPMPWVVVNDAVLAAAGFPPPNREKTLVLTLGFGVGGALWDL
jgi:hypothetical protein